MARRKKVVGTIHIPADILPYPEKYEIEAAGILAQHFKTQVRFLPRNDHKTADFQIGGIAWELKSPTGLGKYNIQHALRSALLQSPNIILDARRSKIRQNKIKQELQIQFIKTPKMKRLILITKAGELIEFSKKP